MVWHATIRLAFVGRDASFSYIYYTDTVFIYSRVPNKRRPTCINFFEFFPKLRSYLALQYNNDFLGYVY